MLSAADHQVSPPRIEIPRIYNAAHDLLARNFAAGRDNKVAYLDDDGRYTFAELAARVNRAANALCKLGLQPEDRIALVMHDAIDYPAVFLGAIKAGVIPVALNTWLPSVDYRFMLQDSRAKALVVSASLLPTLEEAIAQSPALRHVIVTDGAAPASTHALRGLLADAPSTFETYATTADDACFWLYSSGSTGVPKGVVHVHSSLIQTAELYARPVLGLTDADVTFSAAKLFFAYGLGNSLTFPLAVGATAILMRERPSPEAVFKRLTELKATVFYGVPTLYAGMLASPALPPREAFNLRLCASAGEALPAELGNRFTQHLGVEILDGIGSTEMLHIFLSNRRGRVRYGTTGQPLPGYAVRLLDDAGAEVAAGELGELHVKGPSMASQYWNNRAKSASTFLGAWTRTGDKYAIDQDGYFVYGGRADDMLKVSGQYVSPFEVEAALMTHTSVLEAAVVGRQDAEGLTKPEAFVVLKADIEDSAELAESLKQHVRDVLAPHKYPRWITFITELPKTATGKIQRFKLRQEQIST